MCWWTAVWEFLSVPAGAKDPSAPAWGAPSPRATMPKSLEGAGECSRRKGHLTRS